MVKTRRCRPRQASTCLTLTPTARRRKPGSPRRKRKRHGKEAMVSQACLSACKRSAMRTSLQARHASFGRLVEQLERKLDRAKRAAVMGAHAVLLDGAGMLRRAVALVLSPAIAAVAAREPHHQAVAGDLGHDRRRGDGDRAAVAAHKGACRILSRSMRRTWPMMTDTQAVATISA